MESYSKFLTLVTLATLAGTLALSTAYAATIVWDRNTEADMDHYNLYACIPANCTVTKTTKVGTIAQPAIGVVPTTIFIVGAGAVALTAVDVSGNESDLSLQVKSGAPIPVPTADTTPPAVPQHVRTQ